MTPKNKDTHSPIDLTQVETQPNFLCEFDYEPMLYYPKNQIDNPHAGPSYICPKCGWVIDSLLTKPRYEDIIKPIEISPAMIDSVPELKGLREEIKVPVYDPEPEEEERLKAEGCKIIDKKIEVKRDHR